MGVETYREGLGGREEEATLQRNGRRSVGCVRMGGETFHVRCNVRSGRDEAPSLCWLRSYHTWTSSEVLSLCLTDVKHQYEHHHVAEEGEAGCPHVRHPSRLEDEVRGERHLF